MSKCDVIIPVYNAFDCVKDCIESVLKNTDNMDKLILIDDKSTDERVLPMLEDFQKRYTPKIVLLKNEKNLGFVKTVNKGMKKSKNDVLLLNSDTEVPAGWLGRMQECAYSNHTIATVTPLSNNATLASVPKIFKRNDLSTGWDLGKMDKLVQECSLKSFPEIPTAHGFCMYIKREALDVVGYFDEENFGKGYGEENDFSFRCLKYGYKNVLCDNVYVFHKESQSFLDEKKDNGVALEKKHPEMKQNLDEWCSLRDISTIGDNIALAMGSIDARPNILVVVHDFYDFENNIGGTTLHIMDIIRELRDRYNFHVLSPEGCVYKVHSFFKETDALTSVYGNPFLVEEISLYSGQYRIMLEKIIKDYHISFVHIHHMKGHFFDIGSVFREHSIKYIISLHDMFLAYPIVSMLDEKVDNNRDGAIDLKVWQRECGALFSGAKYIIAPSNFAKKEYQKIYKSCNIKVIQHGINIPKIIAEHLLGEKKNIAFVGAIFPHKGSQIMEDLIDLIKPKDGVKLHLFGETTAKIRKGPSFINHGKYQREELAKLLKKNKIDLVCVFSLAPETYAYTVDEIVASGTPILTFDIGAAAERIKDNGLGWVIKYTDNIREVYENIKNILKDEAKYQEVIDNINEYEVRSVSDMVLEYEEIYKENVKNRKIDYELMRNNLLEANLVRNTINSCNYNSREKDYFAIVNSTRWRLISKIRVPKKTKKALKKMYKMVRR